MDEFKLIRRYFAREAAGAGVEIGIGDDGAVLAPTPGKAQVQVIDTLVENVHFPQGFNPADIGYRAVAVNLSDIAAMGAEPRWMTMALSMPSSDEDWLESFASGLFTAAAEHGVQLVGGDTTAAPQVVVSVHVTGEVDPGRALRRSGAKPGDTIYVTGTLGDSAAGLAGLKSGEPVRDLVYRFARPAARVAYGRRLVGHASAAIDVSDGLVGDLAKLLAASRAGAEIDLGLLPLSEALQANFPQERQQAFALHGGDDYELCFTAAGDVPDGGIVPVTAIGRVQEGEGIQCRLDGEIVNVEGHGFRHFA